MTATINHQNCEGLKISHRKEKHFTRQVAAIAILPDKVVEAVTLRNYSTDARSYACLWCHGNNIWINGSGTAGGYGYHRRSAASAAAIAAAGIELSEDVSGRGDTLVSEAVAAIAQALYPDARVHLVEAYA